MKKIKCPECGYEVSVNKYQKTGRVVCRSCYYKIMDILKQEIPGYGYVVDIHQGEQ